MLVRSYSKIFLGRNGWVNFEVLAWLSGFPPQKSFTAQKIGLALVLALVGGKDSCDWENLVALGSNGSL